MNSNIRAYRSSDRSSVLSLVERFTSFDLPAWRPKQTIDEANYATLAAALDSSDVDRAVYVAERNGVFAGFIHLQRKQDYFTGKQVGYIAEIAVHPDHEGHGVAGQLLDQALEWARGEGLVALTLEVFEGNSRAMGLYESHGYVRDIVQYTRPVE